jgi:hypothetical protein
MAQPEAKAKKAKVPLAQRSGGAAVWPPCCDAAMRSILVRIVSYERGLRCDAACVGCWLALWYERTAVQLYTYYDYEYCSSTCMLLLFHSLYSPLLTQKQQ